MQIQETVTPRGFKRLTFNDDYNEPCSLQMGSSADEPKIWLGTEAALLTVTDPLNPGKYVSMIMPAGFSAHSRMHLTVQQVQELLPYLNKFVETGNL